MSPSVQSCELFYFERVLGKFRCGGKKLSSSTFSWRATIYCDISRNCKRMRIDTHHILAGDVQQHLHVICGWYTPLICLSPLTLLIMQKRKQIATCLRKILNTLISTKPLYHNEINTNISVHTCTNHHHYSASCLCVMMCRGCMLRCAVERRMQRINTLSLNDVCGYLKTVPVYVP